MEDMTGRPSKYSEDIATQICDRLAHGETLIEICKEAGMPSSTSVYRWLDQSDGFRQRYARARDQQIEHWVEEITAISADKTIDWNRARLMVDTRKWLASKLNPRKYGDKLQHTGADGDGPVVIKVQDEWARPALIEGAKVVAIESLEPSSDVDSAQLLEVESKEAK